MTTGASFLPKLGAQPTANSWANRLLKKVARPGRLTGPFLRLEFHNTLLPRRGGEEPTWLGGTGQAIPELFLLGFPIRLAGLVQVETGPHFAFHRLWRAGKRLFLPRRRLFEIA